VRFTASQYDQAIVALRDAREQLVPDACPCRICHDTGHQAWECGHNPLRAMTMCEGIAQRAEALHDQLHTIEAAMHDSDQSGEIADWREETHAFLHHLAGHDIRMGHQVGPSSSVLPEAHP
jgi:hypothetical protein